MMPDIRVNGVAGDRIAVTDRGLHYGDGLFETLAVRAGIPQLWQRHWRRLSRGCERLGIEGVAAQALWDEAREICSDTEQGVLKIIITRGEAGRGYRPAATGEATRILARYPWPDYPDTHRHEGVAVRVCATRLGRNPALAGMKHLNRLEQVLARREWDDPRIAEGLMLDDLGQVISGTMSNLFMVKAGQLATPRLDECGVEGVMRGLILDLAEEMTIPCQQTVLSLPDLQVADELFLCNALIGLWPVRRMDRQAYTIGPITQLLSERLSARQLELKHES
jgi:4-amino-4-deoxychorismate lyase